MKASVFGEALGMGSRKVPRGFRGRHVATEHRGKLRTSRGSPRHMEVCTARASGISRETVKSGCAREWGGWGRISEDGPGQQNPDRSEGPWGRTVDPFARRCSQAHPLGLRAGVTDGQQRARRTQANQLAGKAASGLPALKPYRGKPAVRNFRGGGRNTSVLRARPHNDGRTGVG